MKINNNIIKNYYQKRSNSNNIVNNLSKGKIKEQNRTIHKKFYKYDLKENNVLNMTNYFSKSKVHLNENILSNENNDYNIIDDRAVFTNNYNSGKDIINENFLLSSNNNSNISNTNLNNNLKESNNKLLLKYIENRYNNIIIRNKIRDKKFFYNNMRSNHESIKYYLKNNFSFNDKTDINYKKKINRMNNKIPNVKELQINEKNYAKDFSPMSSGNNLSKRPNNLKIRRISENSIKFKNKEEKYQKMENIFFKNRKLKEGENNDFNININNYNNIKIINDKNIKDEDISDKKRKKESIKKFLKDIILCMPNNNEENQNISSNIKDNNNNIIFNKKIEKKENISSKENENKITFISINNNMNITNQHHIVNNYEIKLKEKLKNKDENNNKILFKEDDSIIIKEKDEYKPKEKGFSGNTIKSYIDKNKNEKNEEKETEEIKKEEEKDEEELLCNINKGKEDKEKDEEKSNLSQSRDCLYYQNELDKLSTYIKNYYSEKKSYPESNTKFYLFGREIGHGAFGKVNLCLHIGSGHLVAMKTFVKKDSKYKETKEKLKNEVEVLSKLHHPFINQILDNFETDTHFFIVMEYICGDLLSFIRKRNKLNEQIAKMIFKQIIEGLKYIHKKNIIHRDIKLDNILIDTTNTVKICDFGVSRKISKGEKIYERCGTPAYIAPEIYKKMGYTGFQSDVWSAGITLYYILSGNLPFKGNNIHELENADSFWRI